MHFRMLKKKLLSCCYFQLHLTLVIGASKGNDVSFAKLVRLRPSEAIDRTSKLPRRIECSEPRGASFGCGNVAMKSVCPPGTSKLNTKCVGILQY